ncbi:MAG: hypothetical protein D6732_25310 [Methanobacteriota archaeon]|nr:MAG: hypothetical protein D6732_25310 [Euryarchaeota archaeon]
MKGKVTIEIFNILRQRIRTLVHRFHQTGAYKVEWDGNDNRGIPVASGVYIYRIHVRSPQETFVKARKMILLK